MKTSALKPTVPSPRTIAAGEFKAKCLQLMDEVKETGIPVVVTKRGKEVGRFVAPPAEEKPFVPLWGRSPGARITGDIMKPAMDWDDPGEQWKAAGWLPSAKKKRK